MPTALPYNFQGQNENGNWKASSKEWATKWKKGKNHCFLWQVASKSSASVAHQAASEGKSHGDLREFSRFFHYLFTRKALFMGFSGCRAQKKAPVTAIAAPTALRPRATCPTCHSGICHGSSVYNSVGSVAVSKRGRGGSEPHMR